MRKSVFFLVVLSVFALFCSESAAGKKRHAPARGLAQKKQNAAADRHDLTRLENREALKTFIANGLLVGIVSNAFYDIGLDLGEKDPLHRNLYRYARPWTKAFLDSELGTAHAIFGKQRFVITSLVRTREYQRRLCRSNGNAICGVLSWKRSSHLTGATVDISRAGLPRQVDQWLQRRLETLQRQEKIIFVKERRQRCYHVMVLPAYAKSVGSVIAKRDTAEQHRKKKSPKRRPHRRKTRH